jgi:glycosyltransferase involved in cell wall biosynthesis
LKVLQIYYEPAPSGQTAHVLSLSKGLHTRGHDITVVLPDRLQAVSQDYLNAGVKVIALPMRKIIWPVKSIVALLNLVRRERFEIVHVHSQEAGMIARWLVRLGGVRKVCYTPQTIDIRQRRWRRQYVLSERILSRITDQIFSVSQIDANRMIRWGIPAEKVCVVPNGIELGPFEIPEKRDEVCRQLSLDPDRPVIMQVGRLSPQKDPEMFLRGAHYILRDCSDAQLVWIGDGPLYQLVQSSVSGSKSRDNIRLVGRMDRAYRFMAAADVVTLTSQWEGLPYSILEAMACSKPVVSTAVNGCQEIVVDGETGYLVEAGNALEWAKRVLQLVGDPQLSQSMGTAGRLRVEAKYSLSAMIFRIEQAYLELKR